VTTASDRAALLLRSDQVSTADQDLIAARLRELSLDRSLEAACEQLWADLHRGELHANGWLVAPPERLAIHHLYAVACGLTSDPLQAERLLGEALFIAGRIEMKTSIERLEARKRSERGSKGGAPQQVTDEQLLAAWRAFDQQQYASDRGRIKWVSGRLGVSEGTVSKRAKRLNLRN
jgi:hypothetical protein